MAGKKEWQEVRYGGQEGVAVHILAQLNFVC